MKTTELIKENISDNILSNFNISTEINYLILIIAGLFIFNGFNLSEITYNLKYISISFGISIVLLLNLLYINESLSSYITQDKLKCILDLRKAFLDEKIKLIRIGSTIGLIIEEKDRNYFLDKLEKAFNQQENLTNGDFYYIINIFMKRFECKIVKDEFILINS